MQHHQVCRGKDKVGGKSLPFPSSSSKISSPDFSSFPISSTTTPSFTGAEKKCKTQFVQAPKDPSSWKNRSSPTKKKNENEEKVESPSNKEGGYPISSFRGNPEVRDDRSLKKKKSSSVGKESFRSTAFPPTSFSSLPPTPALKAFMDAIPSQVDVTQARRLALAHCHLTSLPASLSSPLSRICALDLSHNDLHATQDLSLLTCMAQLSNLNLSHNPHLGGSLEFLLRSPLESAPPSSGSLVVLSVAHCKLHSLKGLSACQSTLKTLVANDNNLFLYSPFSADSSSIDSFCEDDEILSTPSSLPSTTPQERQWGIESYLALQAASLLESVILSRNTLLGTLSPPSSSLASLSSSDAAGKSVATRAAVEKRNSKKDERVENSESISDCRRGNKSNTEKKSYKKLDEDNDKEEEKERCNWEMQEQQANKHPLSVFAHLPHLKKLSLSACGICTAPIEEKIDVVPPYVPHHLHSFSSSSSSSSSSFSFPKLERGVSKSYRPTVASSSKRGAALPKKRKRSYQSEDYHQKKGNRMSALLLEYLDDSVEQSQLSSSCSYPQLFRIAPEIEKNENGKALHPSHNTNRNPAYSPVLMGTSKIKEQTRPSSQSTKEDEETANSSWKWWSEKVAQQYVTKDALSRERLLGIQTHLQSERAHNPNNVELDLSQCYFERSAPIILGRLLTSTAVPELRWITSLRLDGNFFTDEGFWALLSILRLENPSRSGHNQRILPQLKELYLNHASVDYERAAALLAILFPIYRDATVGGTTAELRIGNNVATVPSLMQSTEPMDYGRKNTANDKGKGGEYARLDRDAAWSSTDPLFPFLTTLSLSDNEVLGLTGFVHILRSLIATHYHSHELTVLNLSRCGIGENGVGYLEEFFQGVRKAHETKRNPVVPHHLLLSGNPIAVYCQQTASSLSFQAEAAGERVTPLFSMTSPNIRVEV